MAVIGEPPLLFLDEPSSGIDPQNRRFMWKIIEDLRSEERAVILTTHHLEEAEVLAEEYHPYKTNPITQRDRDVKRKDPCPRDLQFN